MHNNQNSHDDFENAMNREVIHNAELIVWAIYLKAYKPTSENRIIIVKITIIAPIPIPPYIAIFTHGTNDKNPK